MRDNPDVTGALALWRACDGKPGVEALRILSTHAVDALALIDAGRSAKMESDMAQDRAEARAREAAHAPTKGRRR